MNLIAPGISVTVTDDSFYIPAASATTPLIFVATSSEKQRAVQPDISEPATLTPCLGTYESNVVRSVTSLGQSISLYGIPTFWTDDDGNQLHGDSRNEYGLLALNRFLNIGNSAYVVRAAVNTNDDRDTVDDMWERIMMNDETGTYDLGLSYVIQSYVTDYISNYNIDNQLQDTNDPRYKTSVSGEELQEIIEAVLAEYMGLSVSGNNLYFSNDTFRTTRPTFFEDQTTLPLEVFATNTDFTVASVDTYLGVVGEIAYWEANELGSAGYSLVVEVEAAGNSSPSGLVFVPSAGSPSYSQIIRNDGGDWSDVTVGDKVVISNAENILNNGVYTVGAVSGDVLTLTEDNVLVSEASSPSDFLDSSAIVQVYHESDAFFSPTESRTFFESLVLAYENTREYVNATTLGGTDAQRRVAIVQALAAAVQIEDLKSDKYEYNLILCPGYYELADEMLTLSESIGEEALVIAETPLNMDADQVVAWAATSARKTNAKGLIAYYYPHGLLSNLDGVEVYGTASGSALRQYAYNDKNANVWDAPAGTQRGVVSDLSQVGYVTGTLGTATTFVELVLNTGQQGNLYLKNINPIVFFTGRGIIVWGQKTSNPNTSALDRVNASRTICYIRRKIRKNTMPFVFQPNDKITRDQVKSLIDGLLGDIMTKRGLYDFLTVCDESNNDAFVLDNNSLVCEIIVKIAKTAEFLYFPIKVVSSGAEI